MHDRGDELPEACPTLAPDAVLRSQVDGPTPQRTRTPSSMDATDPRSSSEQPRPKDEPSLELLRDEGVAGSIPATRRGSQLQLAITCPTTEKRCLHSGQVASPKA